MQEMSSGSRARNGRYAQCAEIEPTIRFSPRVEHTCDRADEETLFVAALSHVKRPRRRGDNLHRQARIGHRARRRQGYPCALDLDIMPEIQHSLAGTDFSARADLAVERAALLARQHRATLHLLHAMPNLPWRMFGRVLVENPLVTETRLHESARERLLLTAQALRDRYGIAVRAHTFMGRAHEQIAEYARSQAVDLTVLGSHGENFVRDLFVGATALKTLKHGIDNALIVRPGSLDAGGYRSVLVAVDFSGSSLPAVEAALRLAPQACVQLLHVYEVGFEGKMRYAGVDDDVIRRYREAAADEARRAAEQLLAAIPERDRISVEIKHGNPARNILDHARLLGTDLIVMGKRGSAEIDRLLLGSVTQHVLDETDRDVLLVAPPEQASDNPARAG